MTTDREALAAALADYDLVGGYRLDTVKVDDLASAARKYLAQLPEKCPVCQMIRPPIACYVCHGSGKVYSADLVAYLLGAAPNLTKQQIVAVLDALNETP